MSNLFLSRKRFWLLIVIVIACGLSAGIAGEIFTRVYIIKDWSLPVLSSDVNLTDLSAANSGLVIRNPQKVVVNQDVQVAETLAGVQPVLVSVFKMVNQTATTSAQNLNYYELDQPLFTGLIMTADGWIVAPLPNNLKIDFKIKNYVAITSDRRLYKIDQLANLKNIPAGLLVFHLAGASNLPVKKIVARSDLSLGQSLLVVNGTNSVWPTTLTALTPATAVLSSEAVSANLNLAGAVNNNWRNSLVFDLAGDLAAIIDNNQEIIPAFTYDALWRSLLPTNKSVRPYLGVNYLDLSKVKMAANNLDKGALLYPTVDQAAVLKNSPAQAAGLKAGDVITWINNQEINATNDLAAVLSTYNAGDKITITYVSAGQEKEVGVTLGELK